MNTVTIYAVQNGWLVFPGDQTDRSSYRPTSDAYVFTSFEQMERFLKEHIIPKQDKKELADK